MRAAEAWGLCQTTSGTCSVESVQGDLPSELMEALKQQAHSRHLGGEEDSDEEDPTFDPDEEDSADQQASGEQQ